MWSKLDDGLITHPKILAAGSLLGPDGAGKAIGMFACGLMWTNRYLTDGFLPREAVASFVSHFRDPAAVAEVLGRVGLWQKKDGGWNIHDFHDHNPRAKFVKEKRRADRIRKRRAIRQVKHR